MGNCNFGKVGCGYMLKNKSKLVSERSQAAEESPSPITETHGVASGTNKSTKIPVEVLINEIRQRRDRCKHNKEITVWRADFIVCGGCGQRVK